jgi:hypothetical protein
MEFVLIDLRNQLSADFLNQEVVRTGLLEPEQSW